MFGAPAGILTSIVEVGIVAQIQLLASSQSVLITPSHVPNPVTVIEEVAVTTLHSADVIVFVTVYVPGILAANFTTPVDVLTNTNPAVEENVPATPPPLNVGDGFVPF
jgi:hypothetical protein